MMNMNGAANYNNYNNTFNPLTGGNIAKENLIRDINNGVDPDAIIKDDDSNNNDNDNNTSKKNDSLRVDIEPIEFEPIGETLRIDSKSLAEQISAMFKSIFFDYAGTSIRYENGQFITQLFFKDNGNPEDTGDPRVKSVINLTDPIDNTNPNDISFFDKKRIINNRYNAKLYDLTDETKEFLSQFLYGGKNNNKPSNKKAWAQKLTDVRTPLGNGYVNMFNQGYRAEEVALRVSGVNLFPILKKLYGDKMIARSDFDVDKIDKYTHTVEANNVMVPCNYEVRFIKFNYVNSELPVFTMHIERYNIDKVNKFVAKEYPWQSFTGTPIMYYE